MTFCLVLPEPLKATNFRRQQRRDGGYDMVQAYTEEELCAYAEICCADLQKQLDAMRHARDLYKSEADAIEDMRREDIAKKDEALRACVEAADEIDLLASILLGYQTSMARDDALRATRVLRSAITQAKEALK